MIKDPVDRIELKYVDITEIKVDAIVNSASLDLLGGAAVSGKINKVAGPELREELKTLNGCMVGSAKITKGYGLPAKRIIHTVGPVYIDGKHSEDILLRMCYKNCLKVLNLNELTSIAFPSISSGDYGFPVRKACDIAIDTVIKELKNYPKITDVIFSCYTKEVYDAYEEALNKFRIKEK